MYNLRHSQTKSNTGLLFSFSFSSHISPYLSIYTLRDLPHTLFGGLASNAAPRRYNLRIVTDIAIVGPRTLVTAGA